MIGLSLSFSVAIALSGIVLTSSASGDVPMVHDTGRPSKQSMIGER